VVDESAGSTRQRDELREHNTPSSSLRRVTGDGGGDEGFPAALGGLDGRWRFAAGGFSRT